TINLEKINILNLAPKTVFENPLCPCCGKRLKSKGKNQGFRCEKCGAEYGDLTKQELVLPRTLKTGLFMTSTRSQRHLTKPLRRYGLEKRHFEKILMIEVWHLTIA